MSYGKNWSYNFSVDKLRQELVELRQELELQLEPRLELWQELEPHLELQSL